MLTIERDDKAESSSTPNRLVPTLKTLFSTHFNYPTPHPHSSRINDAMREHITIIIRHQTLSVILFHHDRIE